MLTLNSEQIRNRLRLFRNHGINSDFRTRETQGTWYYEMEELGYNYRITDLQCALGLSQLRKLGNFIKRRNEIASRYDEIFSDERWIKPLAKREDVFHAHHLYVIRIDFESACTSQAEVFQELRHHSQNTSGIQAFPQSCELVGRLAKMFRDFRSGDEVVMFVEHT